MKLKLLLTFDHELPLGGVRTTYKEAMFDPTKRLFVLADKLEIPLVLFSDVLCAIRFRDWDYETFYTPYTSQLQEAIQRRHDVQLHLHPHWLTSSFENKSFVPSKKNYRLADFKTDKNYSIDTIIKMGIDFLKEECSKADLNYKCIAFRAGGFNMEEPREIITSLFNNGIRFDSSIAKGYYFRSGLSEVNCVNMPAAANWYLGLDGNLRKQAANGLFEVPIASIPKTPFELPTRFKMKKLASQAPRDHGFQIHEGSSVDWKSKWKMVFASRMLSFDNYTLSIDYLMKILHYNVNKYRDSETVILSVLGHPKTMGDYSFYLMESFINKVRHHYPDAEFTTFKKLAEEMNIE